MNLYKCMKPQIITVCSVLAIISVLVSGFNYNTMKEKEEMQRLSLEINKHARVLQEEQGKMMDQVMEDSMRTTYSNLLGVSPDNIRNLNNYLHEKKATEKEIDK